MKIQFRSLQRKCLSGLFLLCLFAGYLSCIFGYSHVHVIDGIRIVHSHPYQDGHEKGTHTQSELLIIAHIGYFIADTPFSDDFNFTPFLPFEANLKLYVRPLNISCGGVFGFSLRAPPFVA